jgi:hypothetical protein
VRQFVAFSGGIDSLSLAFTMPEAEVLYTDTGDDPQPIHDTIAAFENITGRAVTRIKHPNWPGGLPEYIDAHKFFPNHGARFCTRIFKIEAMNIWLPSHLPAVLNIALRYDEPPEARVGNLTEIEGLTIAYPHREYQRVRLDCVRICIDNGLLPRYPAWMARGGCNGCYYKRVSEIRAMLALAPEVYDALMAREESVQDERGEYFYMFPNLGMPLREYKAKCAGQPTLFDESDLWRNAGDRSDMGQACGLFCQR